MEWDRARARESEQRDQPRGGNKSAEKQTHWGERAIVRAGEGRGVGRSSEAVHYFSLTRIFCTQCAFENGVPPSALELVIEKRGGVCDTATLHAGQQEI